jgi:hypothetical protein
MSSHRNVRLLLYDYAAGRLDHAQHGMVQHHLEGCAECREEAADVLALLEKLPGQSNPSADMPPAFWQELLNEVSAQLPVRPKRRIIPVWFSDWIEFISIPRYQAIVGTATVLVLAAVISGTWLAFRHEPVPEQRAAATPVVTRQKTAVVNTRLKDYLRKSKMLLVGLNNKPLEEGTPIDLGLERTTSRALLYEARYLRDQPLDGRSAALVSDLEKIQIALANSREQEDIPGFRLIRGGIQEENLLFKIRIAETVFVGLEDEIRHAEH